jgi:hypothetical protein
VSGWMLLLGIAYGQEADRLYMTGGVVVVEPEAAEQDDFGSPERRWWEDPLGVGIPLLPPFRPWVVPDALGDEEDVPNPLKPSSWGGEPVIWASVPLDDGLPEARDEDLEGLPPFQPLKDTPDRR